MIGHKIRHKIDDHDIKKFSPERCPHCKVATPQMLNKWNHQEQIFSSAIFYVSYQCTSCCNITLAKYSIVAPFERGPSATYHQILEEYWPKLSGELSPTIPEAARTHLAEARNGIYSPNSSVVASATAVDLMLQEKDIEETSLNAAINEAKVQGLITENMADWAHHIRIEANGSRHRKIGTPLATKEDAEQSLEFAVALAEFLFVLPARVTKGIEQSQSQTEQDPK